jgi:hypothetical protein
MLLTIFLSVMTMSDRCSASQPLVLCSFEGPQTQQLLLFYGFVVGVVDCVVVDLPFFRTDWVTTQHVCVLNHWQTPHTSVEMGLAASQPCRDSCCITCMKRPQWLSCKLAQACRLAQNLQLLWQVCCRRLW